MRQLIITAGLFLFVISMYAAPQITAEPGNRGVPETKGAPQVAEVASAYKGIVKLDVNPGQHVKKGQLLFEVNSDILKLQKKFDEENLKFMQLCMQRAEGRVKKHSISVDDYQQCQRDLGVAKSQLTHTIAQIEFSKYYSPFDGTITKIIRYDGSGLGDNDDEVEVTQGNVKVNTENPVALVCNRWPGILDLKVKLGEKVKKGQLLFNIKTDEVKAQKEIDTNKMLYSQKFFEREQKLLKTSTVSLYAFYKARTDYQEALKNVKVDDMQIEQSASYAPFDGKVTAVFRYSGSGNGAGKPVLNITAEK